MNQGLRRWITVPMASRAGSRGPDATAAPVRTWPLEEWRNTASCRDSDPNLFYPLGRGRAALEQADVAKAICRACPSRGPCLTYALATRQDLGVWGGTSPEDRRELILGRRSAVAS